MNNTMEERANGVFFNRKNLFKRNPNKGSHNKGNFYKGRKPPFTTAKRKIGNLFQSAKADTK